MYLKIEVCSLTCLFVYKVLNQEVLDDRGKFEVSLWKNEFWKSKTRYPKNTFILLTLSRTRSFSRACDKEYDPNSAFISGWEVSGLEENFKCSIMQASRQSESLIVRPPTGTSRLVGGETGRTFTKMCKKHRKSFANSDERKVLPKVKTDHILYQLVCCCMPTYALDRCIHAYAYTYIYIHITIWK